MARLAGVDLPREKRVEIGLTYIYGIGLASSQKILAKAKVNPDIRVKDLTDDQIQAIRNAMEGYTVEGDLRREVALNIKRLDATEELDIEEVFQLEDKEQKPMLVQEKDLEN